MTATNGGRHRLSPGRASVRTPQFRKSPTATPIAAKSGSRTLRSRTASRDRERVGAFRMMSIDADHAPFDGVVAGLQRCELDRQHDAVGADLGGADRDVVTLRI